jgi:hypothetical protein
MTKLILRTLTMAAFAVLLLSACGGGDSPAAVSTSSTPQGTAAGAMAGAPGKVATGGSGDVQVFGVPRGGLIGEVESVDNGLVRLSNPAGKSSFRLRPETVVRRTVIGARADLAVGTRVSVTGVPGPDGRTQARLIELGHEGEAATLPGGVTATPGAIESVTDDTLRVKTATGAFVYILSAETRITRFEQAASSDLGVGAFVIATTLPDSGDPPAAGVVTISEGKVFGAQVTGGAPGDGQRIILTPQASATQAR